MYAPREQQDANDYSEMLGYTTVRKRNRSRSYGQQGNYTLSENEERRALMLPQELKALGNDKEVFFYEGIPHPVLCEKIKYFKDKHFTSRLLPKVKIKPLQIGDGPMPNKVQDTVSAMAMLALTACAVQPVANQPAQAAPQEISQTAQAALGESATPTNPAEALGRKLLKLIDSLNSIDDLTEERIDEAMGVQLVELAGLKGLYEFRGELTEGWGYTLRYDQPDQGNPPLLRMNISGKDENKLLSMTDVCLEFESFSNQIIARGYERQAYYARFASVQTNWKFYRPDRDNFNRDSNESSFTDQRPLEIAIDLPLDEFRGVRQAETGRLCVHSLRIMGKGS